MHNRAISDTSTSLSDRSTPYKFTGKEQDPETGLYYYGYRYLDPKLGGWLSPDMAMPEYLPSVDDFDTEHDYYLYLAQDASSKLPGIGGVFNSVNLNPYHYGGLNPVKFVDPDGREDVVYTKSTNPTTDRFESEAHIYKDCTFQEKSTSLKMLRAWVAVKEAFGGSVGKGDVEFFLGEADKTFSDFSTLSDDPSKYGTISTAAVLDYKRGKMASGLDALILNDSGRVPQDCKFNNGINPNTGKPHLTNTYIHARRRDFSITGLAGSKGCPVGSKMLPGSGGLLDYLDKSKTGKSGHVIIYR